MRAPTIAVMLLAMPHSIDARVKPRTAAIITCLRPKRLASQLDSGVPMAVAII